MTDIQAYFIFDERDSTQGPEIYLGLRAVGGPALALDHERAGGEPAGKELVAAERARVRPIVRNCKPGE